MYTHSMIPRIRPAVLLSILLIVCLGGLWQLADNAANRVDEEVSRLQSRMLQQEILRLRKNLSRALHDYAVWDEMYERTGQLQPDMPWLAENMTGSVYQNLDVDVARLVDADQGPLYTLQYGQHSDSPRLALPLEDKQWQHLLRQAERYDPRNAVTGPNMLLRVNRYSAPSKQLQPAIFLIAIQRISPENDMDATARSRYLLFARELNARTLQEVSQAISLQNLSLNFSSETMHIGHVPVYNNLNERVGTLEWEIARPGDIMLNRLLPQSLLLLTVILLLGGMILRVANLQQKKHQARTLRLERQGKTLQKLVAARYGSTQALQEYLDEILPIVSQTLDASRISVWQFSADQNRLRCLTGVDTRNSQRFSGSVLELKDHGDYFGAIRDQRFLATTKAQQDIRLQSLQGYLAERNIRSMLDAGINVGGLQQGILCAESEQDKPEWVKEDIEFICATADIIAMVMESSAHLQAEGELYRQFYYDRFTGLPNKSRLQMQLTEQIQQREATPHERGQRPIGCLMISLEGLANVNELYGRDGGDQLLRQMTDRLEKLLGNGEMAARYADNRFAMLLLGEDEASLSQRIDAICEQLAAPANLHDQQVYLRLSTGVSIYPHDSQHGDALLENAELALQLSRNDPAGHWVRFRPEMNENWRRRHRIQNDLRMAVGRRELTLFYQPYIALSNGQVAGAEALIRWQHPDLGLISPADFIPLAEETGQINQLGEWVLGEAISQAAQWRLQYLANFVISVNVSLLQLEDPRFTELVTSLLATHHLPAQALELEVTEGLALRSTPAIDHNLERLRAMGIAIAIDDFGTGYASFSYLRRFPVEKLKIDKEFLDQVPDNTSGSNLVRMIVAMGHALGASVTGEGIENIRQARFLAEHGGDYAQGYLFSKPLPAGEMARFLNDNPAFRIHD